MLCKKQLDTLDKLLSDIRSAINVSEKSFATMFDEIRSVGWSATPNNTIDGSENPCVVHVA